MPDFVIPVARADLLKRATPNAYVVNEVFSVRHLRTQLPKCQRILSAEGHVYILRAFDILFSVLHEWSSLSTDTKEEAWTVTLKGCEISVRQLVSVLESNDSVCQTIDRSELAMHRNALKMHVYLLCQFVDVFENELNAHAKSTASVKAGRAKSRGRGNGRVRATTATDTDPSELDLSMDWICECEKAVGVLDQLCRLQLNKLWDPPVAEEDFVNLPANCCYKLLENRAMASSVNVRLAITSLLASLVRRYGHSIACCVKLTQLLQCFPHMVNCLLAFVRSFMEEENIVGVVRELLKEICSYNGADLERDAQTTQNFSSFLLEVANAYPTLAQSILPLLRPRLDEDPYQMRNCVLGIIGEILSSFARREHLDPKESLQRDRLMDLLQEHIHDINGYVRAKALQIWYAIVSTRGLPVRRQSQFTSLLVGPLGAMMDVSSFARRYACKTLTAMVLQSPATKLTPEELQQVLNKETKRLENLEELLGKVCPYEDNGEPPLLEIENVNHEHTNQVLAEKPKWPHQAGANGDLDDPYPNGDKNGLSEASNDGMEEDLERPLPIDGTEFDATAALEAAIHSAAAIASHTPSTPRTPLRSTSVAHAELSAEAQRQRACVAYLQETLAFSSLVHVAIRDFQTMLASKTLTDVTEAIDFFVTAKHAGVRGLEAGIQQIFVHIWSQDEPIRKAVVEAFRKLYLQTDPDEPLGPRMDLTQETADIIVTNLSRFIREADVGSMVSMERIIQELTCSDQLNPNLCSHFWRRFVTSATQNTPDSKEDVKSMLLILKMMVKPGPAEFDKHMDTLIQYGLDMNSDPGKVDMERVKFTCDVLQRMVPRIKPDKSTNHPKGSTEPFRLQTTHLLFIRLRSILISSVSNGQQNMWIPMMEQAIGTIYDLAESPETIAANVISSIADKLIRKVSPKSTDTLQPTPEEPAPPVCEHVAITDDEIPELLKEIKEDPERLVDSIHLVCPSFYLSRFLALAGHCCLKQLVHLESTVLNELKRRAALKEERDAKARPRSRKNTRQSRMSTASFANASTLNTTTATAQNTAEEESGLVGVAADDAEADFIRHISDHELLTAPNHFFSPLLAMVSHVCSNPCRVRTNALNTLSHLILNDMVKVKGQISEMTVCLVDKIERLNVLARQFFSELAQKGTALYNVVPDIISRLSDPEIGVSEEDFHSIMEFLLPLIGRERLCETLVEKICARFRTTRLHRQWRDLAYCLTVISFNERSMRVLYENIPAFADKLCLPEVYAAFELLLANAKKFTKPDGMARLEEFEAKVNEMGSVFVLTSLNEDTLEGTHQELWVLALLQLCLLEPFCRKQANRTLTGMM
ncbi:Condensin complex subunit 1 [Paragonimus heterotremus]|uniref:Condensin complex subunit 1 n=1 Tax=Paragonimus heterotremus TaxID=100268 RepID=A0A8J4SRJ7_9TREM|nr:Condensin complex subunit 1 [Paragonimus heterotremus]